MKGRSVYSLSRTRTESTKSAHGTGPSTRTAIILGMLGVALVMMTLGVTVEKDAIFQVGNMLLTFKYSPSVSYLSQQNSQQPATIIKLMGGGSASSHLHSKAKSTKSAPGIMHMLLEGMEVRGVAQVKRLEIGLTGLTVEKDATFQVGNTYTLNTSLAQQN